jgi:hypothetical protein
MLPIVLSAWKVAGPLLSKHGVTLLLVALLGVQQVQARMTARRHAQQVEALTASLEGLKTELASARGTIQKLSDAAANLQPGETKTVYVDRPVYLPGKETTKEIPVVVTRTEKAIETRLQTVQLPGKEIERIVNTAPQSIVAELTATRDIRAGEKFKVTMVQAAPGIYQPLLELGAPITAEVKTVTPVERIPAPPAAPRRLEVTLYTDYSTLNRTAITGATVGYRLSDHLHARGVVEYPWNGRGLDYRLGIGWRF